MGAWGNGVFDNDTACDWATMLDIKRLSLKKTLHQELLPSGQGIDKAR